MKTIPIDQILISPTRQRRVFDPAKMQEFSDGIARRGLLHPIILRQQGTLLALVAGERRLRAISSLAALGQQIDHDGAEVPLGEIPYTLLTDLSPLAAEEAELEENVHREDLTWQERATANARLAKLRTAQHAESGLPPPTVAEIAAEVRGSGEGSYQKATRRELLVADYLDRPEVAGAKTLDEAFKALKRSEDAERNRSLGELVGRTFTADSHQCINASALDWLTTCPPDSYDVILTDPPYGMGADEFGDSGGLAQGAHGYEDTIENFVKILAVCQKELYRIAKPQAHLYWFCDIDSFFNARAAFDAAGWQVFRTPLIWHKPSAMRAPWPEHGPQRKWECCLYAVKGKRKVTKMAPDLFAFNPDANLGHAAQKPVALFEELLKRSVQPGDSVLDPFCGTGPIFPAAHGLKCRATGVEIDTASYGIAVKRIEALKV